MSFCMCENKGADQLRSSCEADHRLCFRNMDIAISLHFQHLAIFYDCIARFVSDLFKNHIVCFLMSRLIYDNQHDREQLTQMKSK